MHLSGSRAKSDLVAVMDKVELTRQGDGGGEKSVCPLPTLAHPSGGGGDGDGQTSFVVSFFLSFPERGSREDANPSPFSFSGH